MLDVTVHRGPLEALAGDWDRVNDPRRSGAPFRSYAWLAAWWEAFPGSGELTVLVVRDRGQVVALLPLYLERLPLGGARARLLGDQFVGSDYLGLVCHVEDGERAAEALAPMLGTLRLSEILFDHVAEDEPLVPAIAASAARACLDGRYPCPIVRVGGRFDAYLAARPGGVGAQWRRRRRWLERRPGYGFEVAERPGGVAAGLEVLFDLHRRRWALEGGSDGIMPHLEDFHRIAARRLAERGWARLYLLHVEGAARAALYGFQHGGRLAFYQAGHDPAWRGRSVGTVLLGLVLERCFADGLEEFDFLHGAEPYKLAWANDARRTRCLRTWTPGLRPWLRNAGRELEVLGRGLARRTLPEPLLRRLRARRLGHGQY